MSDWQLFDDFANVLPWVKIDGLGAVYKSIGSANWSNGDGSITTRVRNGLYHTITIQRDVGLDLSRFAEEGNSIIQLYHKYQAADNDSTYTISLLKNDTNYAYISFSPSYITGWYLDSWTSSDFTIVGDFNWSDISYIQITHSTTSSSFISHYWDAIWFPKRRGGGKKKVSTLQKILKPIKKMISQLKIFLLGKWK